MDPEGDPLPRLDTDSDVDVEGAAEEARALLGRRGAQQEHRHPGAGRPRRLGGPADSDEDDEGTSEDEGPRGGGAHAAPQQRPRAGGPDPLPQERLERIALFDFLRLVAGGHDRAAAASNQELVSSLERSGNLTRCASAGETGSEGQTQLLIWHAQAFWDLGWHTCRHCVQPGRLAVGLCSLDG